MLEIERIKSLISENIVKIIRENHYLHEQILYTLSLPSKNLRPVLVMLTSQIFEGEEKKALNAATALELFHNFTLVHDDIMDEAQLRRGKLTIHKKWNTNTAILTGDVLLALAYQTISQINSKNSIHIFNTFTQTALNVCKGQELDLYNESADVITKENYLETVRLKTGVLFGASMQIGSLISDAVTHQESQILYNIGENLGIAFQLLDDLYDLYPPKDFGKTIGGDVIANKKTILSITACEKATKSQIKELQKINNLPNPDQKIQATKTIFDNLNLKDDITHKIESIYTKSIKALNELQGKIEAVRQLEQFINNIFFINT